MLLLVWELLDNTHPVVDLSLLAMGDFWSGATARSCGYALFIGSTLLLPLWLRTVMGWRSRYGTSAPRCIGRNGSSMRPSTIKPTNPPHFTPSTRSALQDLALDALYVVYPGDRRDRLKKR